MVTKIVQKHFLCPFWAILVTIICDVKLTSYVWTSLCQFIFLWTSSIVCVWLFDIWHLLTILHHFDNLTSFWQFDVFLTFWHLFNLNHLSPSQGYFFMGLVSELWPFEKLAVFGPTDKSLILRHEGLTILMQCHLGICRGPFYLPKATFWGFVRLTVFS